MRSTFFRNTKYFPGIICFCVGIILCIAIISNFILDASVAYAQTALHIAVQSTACQVASDPTSNSLLAILLDRSGSLKYGTGSEPPTDPQGYSTSVTKALVDLWPGTVVIIPFSGSATPVLGSVTSSNPFERAYLKSTIEGYPIGGGTPLAPAMQQALYLLSKAPSGSRAIIITDGSPDGVGANNPVNQEKTIRSNLIQQFCTRKIPVGVFGLTIATSTPEGQDATRLLTDIARGTGSEYRNIEQPTDLAQAVIGLYAQWLHLSFIPLNVENGNASLPVDSFVKQAIFITFGTNTSNVTLYGPDGQPVKEVQQLTDPHYVIDQLDGEGPIVNGIYTVSTGNTPQTQVYVLISSAQRVQVLAPLPGTITYTGRSIPIRAAFFDGDNILTPNQGHGVMTAYVTFLVNGKQTGPVNTIVLTQEGAVFSGQTLVYKQAGDMQITIVGTYQGVTRQAGEEMQLLMSSSAQPCWQEAILCFAQQHAIQAMVAIPLAALFLFLLFVCLVWLNQAAPFGTLMSSSAHQASSRRRDQSKPWSVPLGTSRTLGQRVFHKSVINSREIERHPDASDEADFKMADFDLLFKKQAKSKTAYIRQRGNGSIIRLLTPEKEINLNNGTLESLKEGYTIKIDNTDVAVFSEY